MYNHMRKYLSLPALLFCAYIGVQTQTWAQKGTALMMGAKRNHLTTDTAHGDMATRPVVGAEVTDAYFPLLKGKRVAVMTNQTGVAGDEHLVDLLLRHNHNLVGIFSPEHGFRGTADAGEHVADKVDEKTGIPIWSLYGSGSGKPSADKMNQFDVLLFDLQDVGVRFYTYNASMARLMDACAEYGKKMIVLDRPNPNGMYVDGPILDRKHKSGVGWLPSLWCTA